MTFKGFNDSKRLLDRSQKFDMLKGKKISALLPRPWKKSFNNGVVIPVKMRRCNNCNGEILCNECNNQIIENKEFEADLNELKRHSANEFGNMLPYYKIQYKFTYSNTNINIIIIPTHIFVCISYYIYSYYCM